MSRLVLVLSLLVAVSGLHAQEDEPAMNAAVRVTSQNIFRGVKSSAGAAAGTFQVARNGWRVGADISQPFNRDEPGEGKIHVDYNWKATKQLKLEAILVPRWMLDAPAGTTKRFFETGLSAAWELPNGFTVELAGFHDWRLKANTLAATINYSQPLKSLGAYLEWSATIGTASARDLRPDAAGAMVRDSYNYYSASVRLPYRISARSTVIGGLHVAESANQSRFWSPIAASGQFRLWWDVGLSVDF